MQSTLSQQAYDHLRRQLSRGELPPGSRLVNRTLADQIGMSFTPVREAINRLASEGLVEYVRGAGAYVRRVDRQELAELYDVRIQFEPFAAEEAASHITKHEVEELEAICDSWLTICRAVRGNTSGHGTPEQMNLWIDLDEQYHKLIVRASRNRWLQKLIDGMQLMAFSFSSHRTVPEYLTLSRAAITWRRHAELVRALRKHDREQARYWMELQIRRGRESVLKHFAEKGGIPTTSERGATTLS
jgi:DNA-binding GntR family transcriptional regulator